MRDLLAASQQYFKSVTEPLVANLQGSFGISDLEREGGSPLDVELNTAVRNGTPADFSNNDQLVMCVLLSGPAQWSCSVAS